MRQVTCSPRPPTLSQRHMNVRVWLYPWLSYIFQVSKSIRWYWRHGGWTFLVISITLAVGFYSSLYYYTSHDSNPNRL